jgi:FKBP-type peptidyl-prolyl cis-trans isomerase FkpA
MVAVPLITPPKEFPFMKTMNRVIVVLVLALALSGQAAPLFAQSSDAPLATEDDKVLYAVGLAIAQQLGQLGLSEKEVAVVQLGVADAALGKTPKVDLMQYGPKLQTFAQERLARGAEAEKAQGSAYLEQAAAAEGAVRTESGLVYSEITPGTGASPTASDSVTVHYRGTLIDGTQFDSSIDRGQPASFPLGGVISCWTEGLQKMKVGGKSRLVCPSDIAYGDQGRPPSIPGGAVLVFEIELLSIGEQAEGDSE